MESLSQRLNGATLDYLGTPNEELVEKAIKSPLNVTVRHIEVYRGESKNDMDTLREKES